MLLLLVIPLLLLLAAATWFFGKQSSAARQWDRRLAELDQRGDPIDSESLQTFYEARTSDENTNAWVDLRETIESDDFEKSAMSVPFLRRALDGNLEQPPTYPEGEWPDEDATRAFLDRWSVELNSLRKIAKAELVSGRLPVRRPITFRSIETHLPDTLILPTLARILQLESIAALSDGDDVRLFDCVQACRGLARSADSEPLMINQLFAIQAGQIANEILQAAVERDRLTNAQLDMAAASMSDFGDAYQSFTVAVQGERAIAMDVFDDPKNGQDMIHGNFSKLTRKTRAVDAVYYLDLMEDYQAVPGKDMQRFRAEVSRIESAGTKELQAMAGLDEFSHAISKTLQPPLATLAVAWVDRVADNRLTRVAICVRKFRREYGRWPDSFDELRAVANFYEILVIDDAPFEYRFDQDENAVVGEQIQLRPPAE